MLPLPREPRCSELAIGLYLAIAANYKLGASVKRGRTDGRNTATGHISFAEFLQNTQEINGEPYSSPAALAEPEQSSKLELPPARYFFGYVLAKGEGVAGISENSLVLVIANLGPQRQYGGKILFCHFYLLVCQNIGNIEPEWQHPQEEEGLLQPRVIQGLAKALARIPHLVEGLQCCSLKLKPRDGDILGICCKSVVRSDTPSGKLHFALRII
ncbi:uncharacterized protein LOC113147028 [Cyclospora cayetanensis]|uniref:Uncharacterized protein LOC113147028 n=1 Tax=Cyclospora cayetanensis TaxID=88456 RepID=A0A6P6RXS9_9EIME|nr:uncharacterized protein LOC113147028 [Cyclospora cayetanensis]